MSGSGRVSLIGAGPGDPELITVLGLKRLRAADVVLHDRLAAPELLSEAKVGADIVDVGKRPGDDVQDRQRRIEKLIVERAQAGAHVVRLKGGDPSVFGRGDEEIEACAAAGVPCLGFAVVSARNADGGEPDWSGLSGADTVVVLMPARRLERIGRGLIAAGRRPATPVAVVERATTTEQRTVRCTLQTLAAGDFAGRIKPPCVVIVGDVAGRRFPFPRTDG